jgi:hypothetical protein
MTAGKLSRKIQTCIGEWSERSWPKSPISVFVANDDGIAAGEATDASIPTPL